MRPIIVVMTLCTLAALLIFAWQSARSGARDTNTNDTRKPAASESAPPVACTLGDGDLVERGQLFVTELEPLIREVKELDDGYALRFDAKDGVLGNLVQWIDGERQCCAFPTYRVSVEAGGGPIWFDMTGSPDAKRFVGDMLDVAR